MNAGWLVKNPGIPTLDSVATSFEMCAFDYTRNALSHKNITTPISVGLFKSNMPALYTTLNEL